ncbi:uncharacterized protein LOC108827420 [Raphanus sativus]|uniref:Uncharacterized protein LOC108827420 n=1 Tax=Raphanus sativus TaxID=3726 RepID=A0A9W3D8X6_RAPSA|nr:uncharacterized protein LOC108827420 [Raphanus sativus]
MKLTFLNASLETRVILCCLSLVFIISVSLSLSSSSSTQVCNLLISSENSPFNGFFVFFTIVSLSLSPTDEILHKVGSFHKNDPSIGTGLTCGDVMKLASRPLVVAPLSSLHLLVSD